MDGKRRGRLEKQVPAFVDKLVATGIKLKERDAEHQRWEVERREREARAFEERQRELERQRRREALLSEAAAWRAVEDFEAYADALRAAASLESHPNILSGVESWIDSARRLLADTNPLPNRLTKLAAEFRDRGPDT